MKEQFRDVEFSGNINIKYKDASGAEGMWTKGQDELREEIESIVERYQAQGITMTNRMLYYQLVTANIIPNAEAVYKRLCTFITDARYGGYIDWDAIDDLGRVPERHSQWVTLEGLIESAIASYRLPRWNPQEYYVELFCEKQALTAVLQPIANKFHIYFCCNKGYSSAATMYELYKRMHKQILNGKKCVVLYMGDHDPSGLDMVRDIEERITEFLLNSADAADGYNPDYYDGIRDGSLFTVDHLALQTTQVRQYNPPPNPAKVTDPRAKDYVATHGRVSWELDSLNPTIMRNIAEAGILQYCDVSLYNEVKKREKVELEAFKTFFEGFMTSKKMKKILKDTKEVLTTASEDSDDEQGEE